MVVWRVTELIIREKALLCDHTGLFIRYKLHRSGERNHWPWLGYAWYYVTHTYKDSKHWPTEMLSIARHLKNLRSFCTHDRPHTKWNIHTAETYHLHGRNVYDIHESMRGYPSFLVFQNTCTAKLQIPFVCQSNLRKKTSQSEQQQHTFPTWKASLPTTQLRTSVDCILPSTNTSQPTELFSVANTVHKPEM